MEVAKAPLVPMCLGETQNQYEFLHQVLSLRIGGCNDVKHPNAWNEWNESEWINMNGFTQSHGCTLPYFAIVYCFFQHVSMFATREMNPMSPWGWNASGCWESGLVWPKQGQKQRLAPVFEATDFNRFQQISTDFNSSLSSHNLTFVCLICLRIMSWGCAKSKLRGSSATRGGWTRRIRRAATLCSKGGFWTST